MAKLTFYGGVNEIGGNKILLEEKGTKILFDFGQSFNFGADYFTGWLAPRSINGLGDHFEFGLLPKIPGLYAKEQLAKTDFPYSEPEISAVFLSHGHFDHVAHICFIDPKIPVYLGAGTKLFMESMEETSSFCDYKSHNYRTFRTGKKITVDNIEVEPVHVDHSIPAAYGFIVRTDESTIVYTGDFRLHGPRRDLTEDFLKAALNAKPDALICEGTRMAPKDRRQNFSEKEVAQGTDRLVASSEKMVFVTHYSRDMDRFRSFYEAAVRNQRKIVVSPKTAYLLSKLGEDKHLKLPDPLKDDHILVYYKRKKTGTYSNGDYYPWERTFMGRMADAVFIHENQRKLIMDLDFYQFAELIDIKPEPGSIFIHSMSEPFSEEDLEDAVLHNWLKHFGLQFHQLHASGHLCKEEIKNVVKTVNAKKVFPVHTESPDLFKKISKKVQEPNKEQPYTV